METKKGGKAIPLTVPSGRIPGPWVIFGTGKRFKKHSERDRGIRLNLLQWQGRSRFYRQSVAQSIAAGEAGGKTASAVKELIENAIDAQFRDRCRTSGRRTPAHSGQDNGEGIEADDVPLALQRYGDKQISDGDDLFRIHTLGFRGEALPSIASVSSLTLKTRFPTPSTNRGFFGGG